MWIFYISKMLSSYLLVSLIPTFNRFCNPIVLKMDCCKCTFPIIFVVLLLNIKHSQMFMIYNYSRFMMSLYIYIYFLQRLNLQILNATLNIDTYQLYLTSAFRTLFTNMNTSSWWISNAFSAKNSLNTRSY